MLLDHSIPGMNGCPVPLPWSPNGAQCPVRLVRCPKGLMVALSGKVASHHLSVRQVSLVRLLSFLIIVVYRHSHSSGPTWCCVSGKRIPGASWLGGSATRHFNIILSILRSLRHMHTHMPKMVGGPWKGGLYMSFFSCEKNTRISKSPPIPH